jgi:PAS domain S-box-containing protein
MSPRQQPAFREHKTEGNARSAAEQKVSLTISTGQISPANLQHKSNSIFFTGEQGWRFAFESSAIGITLADLDGRYLAANTVFQNMVGYTETELRELSFWDITYDEDREAKLRLVRELVEGRQKHFQLEKRYCRKDGALLWVRNNISFVPGSGNVPPFLFTVVEDITRWKRAEEELRDSETRRQAFFENSPSPIFVKDPQGRYLSVNKEFERALRVTEEQIKGKTDGEVFSPKQAAAFQANDRQVLEARVPLEFEEVALQEDGPHTSIVHKFPLFNAEGTIYAIGGIVTDITERKREEAARLYSEERHRVVVEAASDALVSTDQSGNILFVNPATTRIFGYEPSELIGQPLTILMPEYLRELHRAGFMRYLDSGERHINWQGAELIALRKNGEEFPVEVSFGELSRNGHRVFTGFIHDISERKQARIALEKAFEEIKILKDQLYKENLALRDEVDQASMFEEIIGNSPALQAVLSRITKVAPTESTVLITGETGTGKELIARAVHKRSNRSGRAFVSVNCAALAPSLISSELFGHEKGAFTGATQRRLGRFELADGGTIFLDEVGELPADIQVALLRVLQEREFERVGGTNPVRVDVRVIAATNRDLEAATGGGTLRSDLFYRLNVFPIEVPPLRERKDDVLMLLEYFVKRYANKAGKNIRQIDKGTLELFQSYDWPGNIRELQNVVERSVVLSSGDVFSVDGAWLSKQPVRAPSRLQASQPPNGESDREREIIETVLRECRGRVSGPSGAAAKLRIPASTLESKIKVLKIRKNEFKLL